MMRHLLLLALLMLAATPAQAVEVQGLYRAETVVTGKEEPERSRGFRIGLTEVITKLTGRADLPEHAALERALQAPHGFVTAFEYEDRMKGIPIHDEQGTRDRPHYLRMTFDAAKTDSLIGEIGLAKWPGDRPRLAVLLTVRDARRTYILTSDGENGYGQREVLKSAAELGGVPIAIPTEAELGRIGLTPDLLAKPDDKVAAAAKALGGDGLLLGMLALDNEGAFWDVSWQFECQGLRAAWTLDNVTFDEGLRGAIQRAARDLSSAH